jgi:heat shock protein HslJ
MKQLILATHIVFFFCACQGTKDTSKNEQHATPTTADNSRTALDWPGTYTGTTPCADCEGIATALTLTFDGKFMLQTRYLGKSKEIYTQEGIFEWDTDGNRIKLSDVEPGRYQVGEDKLFQLDQEGKRISGNLAEKYILTRSTSTLTEKYWKLVQLDGKPIVFDENMRREAHLIFKDQGSLHGSTSCNQLTGGYDLPGEGKLKFKPLASTRMMCMDNKIEQPFLQALQKVSMYKIQYDTLQLMDSTNTELARFQVVYLR